MITTITLYDVDETVFFAVPLAEFDTDNIEKEMNEALLSNKADSTICFLEQDGLIEEDGVAVFGLCCGNFSDPLQVMLLKLQECVQAYQDMLFAIRKYVELS